MCCWINLGAEHLNYVWCKVGNKTATKCMYTCEVEVINIVTSQLDNKVLTTFPAMFNPGVHSGFAGCNSQEAVVIVRHIIGPTDRFDLALA